MESLLLSAEDSAELLGIGRTLFFSMHSSGRLGPLPVKLGRRVLWNRREIEAWVEAGCPARQQWRMKIFVDTIWILDENVGMEPVVSSLYDNLRFMARADLSVRTVALRLLGVINPWPSFMGF